MAQPPVYMIGKKYGDLSVLDVYKNHERKGRYYARCKCDCGKGTNVDVHALRRGSTTSCGCRRPKPWTPELDHILISMWNDGKSASEIAAMTGKTKDAVVGRAHRLGLSARDNPIKPRSPNAIKPGARRERNLALPNDQAPAPRPKSKPIRPAKVKRATPSVWNSVDSNDPRTCQWPRGDRDQRNLEFCNALPLHPGSRYCREHYERSVASRSPASDAA